MGFFFKIFVLTIVLLPAMGGGASAQEISPLQGEKSFSVRFPDVNSFSKDLNRIVGEMHYQFHPTGRFGVLHKKNLRVGIQLQF